MRRAERSRDIHSGHVALPGGHVDPGESSRDAAIREVEEEMGFDLKSDNFIHIGAFPEYN
jgi:8-oxo-dGTP diphosphatase